MSDGCDEGKSAVDFDIVGVYGLLKSGKHLLHFAGDVLVANDDGKRIYARRHVLERYSFKFKHGKHFSAKADFGVHHILFDIDDGKAFFACDTGDDFFVFRQIFFGNYHSAVIGRIESVFDIDGDSNATHGEYGFGMQNLRSHIRKLAKFAIAQKIDDFGAVHNSWIGGQKSVHVRPVFVHVRTDRTCDERTRYIRAAA